jgi:hypothetical protein
MFTPDFMKIWSKHSVLRKEGRSIRFKTNDSYISGFLKLNLEYVKAKARFIISRFKNANVLFSREVF